MKSVVFLVLCVVGSVAHAHEGCDVPHVLGQKSVGDIAGPVHLEYPFQVGEDWYRLIVDNQPFTSTGNFFLLHKEGKVYTANEPYNSQIQSWDVETEELLESIPVPRTSAGGPQSINSLFITASGAFICKEAGDTNRFRLWRRSPEGVWTTDDTRCEYLGVTSIDEKDGVIMLAEYRADTVLTNRVIRSKDDGRTWETVFSQRALGSPNPEIRHFHTLAVDPWTGEWHLSSGDKPEHSRAWKSSDQGDTWEEITDPDNDQNAEPPVIRTQLLHRQTAPWFTPEAQGWALDDRLFGTGAVWVVSPRNNPLALKVIGRTSFNAPRSAVYYPDLGWLLLTENVTGYSGIELVLVTEGTFSIIQLGTIDGVHSYFSSSSASLTAEGDLRDGGQVAFSLSRGFETMTLRYRIVREYGVNILSNDPSAGEVVLTPARAGRYPSGAAVTATAQVNPGVTFGGYVDAATHTVISRYPQIAVTVTDEDIDIVGIFTPTGETPEVEVPAVGTESLVLLVGVLLILGFIRLKRA